MKLWRVLFKKEFRLMQSFLLVHAFIFLIFGTVGIYLAARYQSSVPSLLFFIAIVWHMFYLLIYILKSLRKEKNSTPIWMQSPQSGCLLLSAKFAAGLSILSISLCSLTGLWLWVMQLSFSKNVNEWGNGIPFLQAMAIIVKEHWAVLGLTFLLRALFLAVLITFIYYIRDVWKNTLGGWRWILFPILIIIAILLMVHFSDSSAYQAIFGWGMFDLPKLAALDSSPHHIPQSLIWGHLSWGDLVFRGLLTSIMFYTTGWLLDRKVEV